MITIGFSTREHNQNYIDYIQKTCMYKNVEIIEKINNGGKSLSEVYNEILEGANWFADFLETSDKLISPKDEITSVLTVFGMAVVNKLAESEKVLIMLDDVLYGEEYE